MIDPSITNQLTDMAPSQTNYTPQDARTAARQALGGADVAMQTDFAAIDHRRKPNDIAVKQTVMPATQFNPDEVAKARAIGAQIGMGQDVVLQQMEDAKRQAYMQELDRRRLPQNDPKLAMFLLNPNNAQLAWDDLDALEETKAVEFFGAVPAFESGVQVDLMAREARKIRAKGDAATKADYDRLEAIEQQAAALYEESGGGLVPGSARLAGQQKEPIKRGLYRGAQAGLAAAGAAAVGGQIGPQAFLPEELVTVPGAAMLFFGLGFTSEMAADTYENLAALSYVDMKRAGIPEQSAQTWSSVAGGIGAGLEFVGMIPVIGQTTSFVGKVIAKEVLDRVVGRGVARAAVTATAQTGLTIGAEMATESAQVVSDAVAMHIAQRVNKMPGILDTPEGRQKVIRDAIEEGVAVGEGMILLAPIVPIAGFGADMRNIKRSRRNIEQFERAIKAIERSRLASRDPAAVQQLIDSRTEGKPESDIYVEGAQIDVILRQNEIDPRSLDGLVPGFSERVNEAVRTGGTVRFTSGEFLGRLMQSEVGQALRQHAKIGSPKAYSAAELKGKAEEIASNLQRMRDEVGTAGAKTQEYIDQVNAIEDEIVAMIEATGKYTPEEARMYAMLQLEFIITTADDNKQSPAELWNEFRNVIVGPQAAQQRGMLPVTIRVGPAFKERAQQPDMAGLPYDEKVRKYTEESDATDARIQSLVNSAPYGTVITLVEDVPALYNPDGTLKSEPRQKVTTYTKGVADTWTVRVDGQLLPKVKSTDKTIVGSVTVRPNRDIKFTYPQPEPAQQAVAQQPVRHPYRSLLRAWDKYNDPEAEIQTPEDLADKVELLLEDGRAPAELEDVVRRFREDQAYDIEVKGRGEMDTAGNALEEAVQAAAERIRTEIESARRLAQQPVAPITPVTVVSPQFYSALSKAVGELDAKAMAASGWSQRIKGWVAQGIVKQAEVDWSGLEDWLKMQDGKVSKEAVQEFLNNNGIRVQVVQRTDETQQAWEVTSWDGNKEIFATEAEADAAAAQYREQDIARHRSEVEGRIRVEEMDDGKWAVVDDYDNRQQIYPTQKRANDQRLERIADLVEQASFEYTYLTAPVTLPAPGTLPTKYGQYKLPGGTNYRELLIRLPTGKTLDEISREMGFGGWSAFLSPEARNAVEKAYASQKVGAQGFRSTHWSEGNVLVHIRVVDRVDANGRRILFVEEIQSDYGQAARDKGIAGTMTPEQIAQARNDRNQFYAGKKDMPDAEWRALSERVRKWDEMERGMRGGVPRAPFVETTEGWLNLALKQIMLEAVAGNYDGVAFVNGQQSADRYSLSQQLEAIDVIPPEFGSENTERLVSLETKAGDTINMVVAQSGRIVSAEGVDNIDSWENESLASVVGAEMAERIMAVPTVEPSAEGIAARQAVFAKYRDRIVELDRASAQAPDVETSRAFRAQRDALEEQRNAEAEAAYALPTQEATTLTGEDLKAGGRGMIAFYDKIVPAAMNKLLKKYGGEKLGTVEIDTRTPESEAWYQELTDADILKQSGFDVTPQVVEKVQGGLPLFQEAMEPSEPLGTFDVEKFLTTVNAKANIATLAHEGAHWWLEVMGRLSARPNVSPRTKENFDGILRWFGIEGDTADARIAKWNSMTLAEKERHHEAFARNWEIMLYEGKAPSAELQTVFEKFSRWMKRLYISIRDQFNAQYKAKYGVDLPMLSPEVRQFMESLIASDEQIARQKAIRSAMGLFDVRPEGMTDAEWEAYQQMQEEADAESIAEMRARSLKNMKWLRRAERGVLRDMQKETDERRAEVRAEVAEAVSQQQVYRARAFLSRGTLVDADGNEQVSENHRLDIDAVQQMYELEPENLRPDLSKLGTGKDGMMGKGGMNPEVAAEMLGYDSADAMIRDLVEAPALEEAIEAETDRVMLERFGDMNTPEQREAAVDSALHGELRSRMNAVELRFLTKVTQPVRILIEAAREVARQIIGEKRLRDIRPREYIAAETRAARDAQEAYQSLPNPETIGKAAYTRSMNEQASAIAAGMAVSDAEAIALQAQQDAIARAEQRNEEYRKKYPQVEPEAVVIAAARKRLLNHELAREALAAQKEVDKGVKYLRNVLSDANRKRMGADAADQVLAILDNYSLVAMTRAQRAKVADLRKWIANAEANGLLIDIDPELADAARRKNYTDMTLTEFRDLVDSVKQIEHVGRNARNIYLAGQKAEFEARRDEINARLTEVAEQKGRKARKELGDEDRKLMNSIASYDASQQTIGNIVYVLDGGERDGPLARYLLMSANEAGNQEAADRAAISEKLDGIIGPLARKGQFAAPKKHFPHINESLSLEQRMVVALNYGNQSNIDRLLNGEQWTDEQARVIIESLTEEQLNAVQAIWDVMSSFRSRVAEKSRRLTGREPRWLEPLPLRVNSADGKVVDLRGGYYPAKYNPRRSVGAREVDIAEESDRLQREAYTATTTSRSYEKNRADKPPVDQVLSRQFVAMYSGLNEVIHDLAWHDFAIAATRLLRDREFQRIIKERYGLEVYNAIKDWVDVVVAGDRTKYDAFEKLAILARQNVSVAAMGIRLMTAAIQPTGIFPAMTRVGVRPMVRALAVFAYSPLAMSRTVVSRSRFMQSRNRTRFRDLNEVQNIVRDQSLFGKVRRGYIASAYVLTSFMQGIVDTSVWMAAYSNSIKAGKSEQDSVFIADQTVIDTQGSGRVQDLSSAMRGGKKQSAYAKLFTPFYQFSNTMYSLLGAQMRTAPTYGKAAKDLFLILTVGAIIEELIRNALRPSEEEQEPEELIKKLVANQIDFVVGLPFGLREMRGVGSFVVGTDDGMQSYRGPSGLRIVTDATQAATQARQGEFDAAFRRSMINLLGTTTGVPSAQINSTIDGIEAAVEGELEGLDIPRALLFGIKK